MTLTSWSVPYILREVLTGTTVQQDAQNRYSWVVRFWHTLGIESYRKQPAHVAFADNRFRPIAGDHISIDYQAIEPE